MRERKQSDLVLFQIFICWLFFTFCFSESLITIGESSSANTVVGRCENAGNAGRVKLYATVSNVELEVVQLKSQQKKKKKTIHSIIQNL